MLKSLAPLTPRVEALAFLTAAGALKFNAVGTAFHPVLDRQEEKFMP